MLAEAHSKQQVYDELITQSSKRYKPDSKKLWYVNAGAVCVTGAGPSLGAVYHLLGVTRDAY